MDGGKKGKNRKKFLDQPNNSTMVSLPHNKGAKVRYRDFCCSYLVLREKDDKMLDVEPCQVFAWEDTRKDG